MVNIQACPSSAKKPIVIEAVQFDGLREIPGVVMSPVLESTPENLRGVYGQIHTLEGVMTCVPGDWVITGTAGETYPCKDAIFRAIYEPVLEEAILQDGRCRTDPS